MWLGFLAAGFDSLAVGFAVLRSSWWVWLLWALVALVFDLATALVFLAIGNELSDTVEDSAEISMLCMNPLDHANFVPSVSLTCGVC